MTRTHDRHHGCTVGSKDTCNCSCRSVERLIEIEHDFVDLTVNPKVRTDGYYYYDRLLVAVAGVGTNVESKLTYVESTDVHITCLQANVRPCRKILTCEISVTQDELAGHVSS